LTIELAIASALDGLWEMESVDPKHLLHFDDELLLSFVGRDDFEAESGERGGFRGPRF
jgi:hypothetical protein